jgi:excisionase family DNA binding protein
MYAQLVAKNKHECILCKQVESTRPSGSPFVELFGIALSPQSNVSDRFVLLFPFRRIVDCKFCVMTHRTIFSTSSSGNEQECEEKDLLDRDRAIATGKRDEGVHGTIQTLRSEISRRLCDGSSWSASLPDAIGPPGCARPQSQVDQRRSMRESMQQPILLTQSDAAKCLAVSSNTVYNLRRTGQLPCVRLGRAVRYALSDLLAWIETRKTICLPVG